jgi:hypothetical protein
MRSAARRLGSRVAVVLTAVLVGLTVLALSPAQASVLAGYKQMENQDRPWFSGPVCLEIDGGSTGQYAPGEVEWCSYNTLQQQWTAVPVPNNPGYYFLKNANSSSTALCLEVSGGLYADGTATVLNWCNAANLHQQWRFVGVGSGWYEVIARHSGKCLTNSGWKALQYNCSGGANQHWTRPF